MLYEVITMHTAATEIALPEYTDEEKAYAQSFMDTLSIEEKKGRITSYNVCYTKLLRIR